MKIFLITSLPILSSVEFSFFFQFVSYSLFVLAISFPPQIIIFLHNLVIMSSLIVKEVVNGYQSYTTRLPTLKENHVLRDIKMSPSLCYGRTQKRDFHNTRFCVLPYILMFLGTWFSSGISFGLSMKFINQSIMSSIKKWVVAIIFTILIHLEHLWCILTRWIHYIKFIKYIILITMIKILHKIYSQAKTKN